MELIYPMFAMVILTTLVGTATAYVRIKSAYSGAVDPRYFKLMSKYDVTDKVAKFGRNFDNLLEVPVLFYAACLAAMTLHLVSQALLVMAWIFFILRIAHTAIHLTYNYPLHRFVPFALSSVCVVAMWVDLVVSLKS